MMIILKQFLRNTEITNTERTNPISNKKRRNDNDRRNQPVSSKVNELRRPETLYPDNPLYCTAY